MRSVFPKMGFGVRAVRVLSAASVVALGACGDSAPTSPNGRDAEAEASTATCDADLCTKAFPLRDTLSTSPARRVYRLDLEHTALVASEASSGYEVCLSKTKSTSACLGKGPHAAAAWLGEGSYYITVTKSAHAAATLELTVGVTHTVGQEDHAMNPDVARAGLQAFSVAYAKHDTEKLIYALTDYSLPSDQKREWVVDLRTSEVLWNLYVAHGENTSKKTDPNLSATFSNVEGSHQSSLGMMRSAETYTGDYGYSFRLDGLEPGYNDLVRPRDIVVHPWFGSTPKYVEQNHKAAPTFGCPAVDQGLPKAFFDTMSNGVLHWYSFPDGDWSEHSTYRL